MKNELSKIPPQDIQAEEAVLSAMLMIGDFGAEAINDAVELLSPEDFYKNSNKMIFSAIAELSDSRKPVDLVTVADVLRKNGLIERIGGAATVARIVETVPVASNVKYYAEIVKRNSVLRKIIRMSGDIANMCFEPGQDEKEVINHAEKSILGLSEAGNKEESITAIKDTLKPAIDAFEKRTKSKFIGIQTGFMQVDKLTSGLQNSDLIILAARPAMGKTSFALNIARNAARIDNNSIVIFSLEMSKEQLVMRMLCSEARISTTEIRRGYSNENDWEKLTDAASELYKLSVYVDDSPGTTVTSIRAKARRFKKKNKLDLIIIDYLQLMKGDASFARRDLEISDISRSLKMLAKELNIPIVALSQLNRKLEDRTDKRPQLSDLRESGALEQDADVVMFIYRDEVYNNLPDNPNKGIAEIIISKQRNGPTGKAILTFINSYTRFENSTPYQ